MARQKKDREVNIVHFSFFDLLFGAFGAFVFLMIVQVISTLNMVDIDIQKLVDQKVEENTILTKELEEHKETDQLFQNLQKQHTQLLDDRKKFIQSKDALSSKAANLESQVGSLQRKFESLKKYRDTAQKKGDMVKSLEKENKELGKSLDEAKRRLSRIKTTPLKLKTKAFPTTITEEHVDLALSAEGGLRHILGILMENSQQDFPLIKSQGPFPGLLKELGITASR